MSKKENNDKSKKDQTKKQERSDKAPTPKKVTGVLNFSDYYNDGDDYFE